MRTQKKHTPTRPELPLVFDSMSACSGQTGIPLVVLRKAKRDGCPAFRLGCRVELLPLLEWIFRPGGGVDARLQALEAEYRSIGGELPGTACPKCGWIEPRDDD